MDKEYSIKDIKQCIKNNKSFIQTSENRGHDYLYKTCIALEELLKEQIVINEKLLSNQKSACETNEVLINRINRAIDKLGSYIIDVGSLDNVKRDRNDALVQKTYCILMGGIDGEKDC